MSAQTIFISLINAGMTPAGAAGAMGNADAESALRANNAQDGMTSLSDEAYTAAVDNGTYARFTSDSVGYGLFQWTYPYRYGDQGNPRRNTGSGKQGIPFRRGSCHGQRIPPYPYLCRAT